MIDDFSGEINIQIRPKKMPSTGLLNIENLTDRGILEPGKIFIGHEKFLAFSQQPHPIRRDMGDFSFFGVLPKRFLSHRGSNQNFASPSADTT